MTLHVSLSGSFSLLLFVTPQESPPYLSLDFMPFLAMLFQASIPLDKCNTFRYTLSMKAIIAETLVEWDDSKNRINIQKHGISFETAALVFADEERIEYYDKLHSLNEDRYVVLGCVQGILYVVYTMRDEAARLISARMATPTERKIYYGE